jgi:hypothetical protein
MSEAVEAAALSTSAVALVSRRGFLQRAAALGAAAVAVPGWDQVAEGAAGGSAGGLIDVNVSLGRWPTRRLPGDDPEALARKLRKSGVRQAWAGSFDGLLHKDIGAVNMRLFAECHRVGRGLFLPFGAINPKLPGWEADLRRCATEHEMRGVRLWPGYHGYQLHDTVFERLLDLAGEYRLVVQIVAGPEDERVQHPSFQGVAASLEPLPGVLKRRPGLAVVLLNWFRAVPAGQRPALIESGQVYFDTSTVEGAGGVEKLLAEVPIERVLFGSHSPFFYFESALLKLQESELSAAQLLAIRSQNAARLTRRT